MKNIINIQAYKDGIRIILFSIFTISIRNDSKILNNFITDFMAKLEYNKLSKLLINSDNKILILEPNFLYHSECLASYIKYFYDLGYSVDLILSNNNYKLKPFCRLNIKNYNIYTTKLYLTMKKLVCDQKIIDKYNKIIFTTTFSLNSEILAENINNPEKVLCITHSFESIDYLQSHFKFNTTLIMYFKNINIKYINPNYFGIINNSNKNKKYTKFITVGRIQKNVKNYNLLIDTIIKLVSNGYKNFKVICIGWEGSLDINNDIRNYIEVKGKLNFEDMFNELEKSDFYLSLLSANIKEHFVYTFDVFTGSNQLVLGFKKPFLINKIFADAYLYDESSAIVYDDDNLYDAMIKAINMNNDEYSHLQNNIEKLQKSIYDRSLQNLKFYLDN